MSYEQHESLDDTDSHSGLIGPVDELFGLGGARFHDDHDPSHTGPLPAVPPEGSRAARHSHRRARRRRGRGRVVLVLALVVVAALLAGSYILIKPHLAKTPPAADYAGPGTGTVRIQVKSGDSADAIGATLTKQGVVASVRAFTAAARANPNSQGIQPGFYDLHSHMSAAQAVTMLLSPDARIVIKVSVPEGTIEKDVIAKLATALGEPLSTVQAAASDVANLGLPDGYAQLGTQSPVTSAEGFLYPDTYNFDPGTTAVTALQQMASEFTVNDRGMGFAASATKLKISPYEALIIASIIEGEAKYDTDRAKVARVILNRLAAKKPLQIDATSVYAAKLQGLDPSKVNFATIVSPYNTYTNDGLPPTPILNPGKASMQAAVAPADGDWLFYVNGDAAGHLVFTADENAWKAAAQKCHDNNWGCAAP